MTYEERKQHMIERSNERKAVETERFLNSVNVLYSDNTIFITRAIKKEYENCYINFNITQYPTGIKEYSIVRYKKDYPFHIYRESKYYEIPEKYSTIFEYLLTTF